MNFLRTIVIIIMVFYVIKIVTRLAFPYLIKNFVSKMENKMRKQQGFNDEYDASKVGETSIDKKPADKTSNKDVGEYVEYEDVE